MTRIRQLIKLTNLNSKGLKEKELNVVIAGGFSCGCFYEACSGSTRSENSKANKEGGLISPLPAPDKNWGIVT